MERMEYDFNTCDHALAFVSGVHGVKDVNLVHIERLGWVVRVTVEVEPATKPFTTGLSIGIKAAAKLTEPVDSEDKW